MSGLKTNELILLFDGHCRLCNGLVQRVLKRDKIATIKMAALQSPEGKTLLEKHGLQSEFADSMVLISEGKLMLESDAAIRLGMELNGFRLLSKFASIFPRFFRDATYRFVARNRFRFFGKDTLLSISYVFNIFESWIYGKYVLRL
jgi:predicted DCC family thiol-disulfide oxidoreductase YuxK